MAYQYYYSLVPLLIGGAAYLIIKRFSDSSVSDKKMTLHLEDSYAWDGNPWLQMDDVLAKLNSVGQELRRRYALAMGPTRGELAGELAQRVSRRSCAKLMEEEIMAVLKRHNADIKRLWPTAREPYKAAMLSHFYNLALNSGELKLRDGMTRTEFLRSNGILDFCAMDKRSARALCGTSGRAILACPVSWLPQLRETVLGGTPAGSAMLISLLAGDARVVLYK